MPSRTKRQTPDEPRFLFVSEGPADPEQSKTTQKTRTKQSHVQRQHFARKKEAELLGLSNGLNKAASPSIDVLLANHSLTGTSSRTASPPSFDVRGGSANPDFQITVTRSQQKKYSRGKVSRPVNSSERKSLDAKKAVSRSSSPSNPLRRPDPPTHQDSNAWKYSRGCPCGALHDITLYKNRFLASSIDLTHCYLPKIGGNHSDPFDASAVRLDEWTHTLISYYILVIIPSMFRADSQLTRAKKVKEARHMPALFDDIRACLTDRAHFYALLTSSASRMQRAEGRLLFPPGSERKRFQGLDDFKGHAIEALRSRLFDGQVDSLMVQDVYRLFAAETLIGNVESAQVHFQALSHMVNVLGGLKKLAPYTMERVILSDIFASVQRVLPPSFPLDWDPGKHPISMTPKILYATRLPGLDTFGQALFTSDKTRIFHEDMLTLFSDLIPLVHANVATWRSSIIAKDSALPACEDDHHDVKALPPRFEGSEMHYLLLRRTAIEHRLLSYPSSEDAALTHNPIQEASRLATLLFIGMTLADPVRRKLTGGVLKILKQTIEKSTWKSQWYPHVGLLLWVCSIASFAAEEADEDTYYVWFAFHAAKAVDYFDFTSSDELRGRLRSYFYLDETQRDAAEKMWARFAELRADDDCNFPAYATE